MSMSCAVVGERQIATSGEGVGKIAKAKTMLSSGPKVSVVDLPLHVLSVQQTKGE